MNKLQVTSYQLQVIDDNRVNSREKSGHSVFLSLYHRLHRFFFLFALCSLLRTLCSKIRGAAFLPGGSRLSLRFILFTILLIHYFTISPIHAKYSGGQPAMFLSWGAGARSLGMGKAFVAISDDASATYWNPAAMVQLVRRELTGLHVALWEYTNYNFLSYVHPTAKFGVFGINYTGLRSSGFEKVLAEFDPATKEVIPGTFKRYAGTFEDSQQAITLAYGRKVLENYIENLSVGIATKYIWRKLDVSEDQILTFDLALFLDTVFRTPVSLGLKIQNLPGLGFVMGDTSDRLPLTFRLGAAYKTFRNRLILASDLNQIMGAELGWHIGAEYWIFDFAAIRVGIEGSGKMLHESTVGFGLKYRDYAIDYAFALHRPLDSRELQLGLSHRFSGTWRFGLSVLAKQEEAIRRLTQEGFEAYRQGDYVLSLERLNKLLDLDPRNREVRNLVAKLETVVPTIPKVVEPTREAELVRRGLSSYIEGDLKTAITVLQYALSLQPQNEPLLKTLNRIEKEIGQRPTEPERLAPPPAAFTYIDQKLYRVLEYIYAKQYDKAVIECQEILSLEPNNVTALERMGSALFLMGQKELAKKVWMKALELNPNNPVVRRALEEIK